tara:strand:- start:19052 stop:19579 length:528 start_codon:yes stop_codon:yes gene_type:complete
MTWFIDGLSVLLLIFFGINGFSRGIIEEIGSLLGLIFSLIIGISTSANISGKIVSILPFDAWICLVLSFTGIFSISLIFFRIITRSVHIAFLSENNKLINNVLGFMFGFLKGFFVIIAFIWLLNILPLKKWTDIISENSKIARTGTEIRTAVVSFFNWEDPIALGESYIINLTQP